MCCGTSPKTCFHIFNGKLHAQRGQNRNWNQRKEVKSLTQGRRNLWIRNHCAQNAFPTSINFLSGICLHIFSYFNLVSLNRKFATAAPGDTPPPLRGISVVLIKLTFHFNEFPSLTMGFFLSATNTKPTELEDLCNDREKKEKIVANR